MPDSRSFQPTAWSAKTTSHVFKPVVPRSDHGMHVSLHRGLNPRYRRPDTQGDPLRYGSTMKIIYRQRSPQRVFSGQAPIASYPVEKVTRRLSCFDPIRGPPGSSVNPEGASPYFPYIVCSKPTYSKAEVSAIVDRLYSRKKEEGRCPPQLQWHSKRQSYPAEMLEEVLQMYCSTEKLCETQPFRNATRHRAKAVEDIRAATKRYSEEEIKTSVRRLSDYNPNTWPPNSKGVIPPGNEPPVAVKYPSAPAPSQAFIDDLVDRLYNGKIDPDAYSQHQHQKQKDKKRVRAKTAPPQKKIEPSPRGDEKPEMTSDRKSDEPRGQTEPEVKEDAHAQSRDDISENIDINEDNGESNKDTENTNKNNPAGDSKANSESVDVGGGDLASIHSEAEPVENSNDEPKTSDTGENDTKNSNDKTAPQGSDIEQNREITKIPEETEKETEIEQKPEVLEEQADMKENAKANEARTDEQINEDIEDDDDEDDPVLRKMKENGEAEETS